MWRKSVILGISAFYHDSAAALVIDGKIVAAAQEERFTRKKHDADFPLNAIQFVLNYALADPGQVDTVVFYEKPLLKFERLLETYHHFAPKGLSSWLKAMPLWMKEKLFIRNLIKKNLSKLHLNDYELLFSEHHLSHAASAFYPSPFKESAILTIDGVGEWSTTTIGYGNQNKITILKELHFPHSLGLLYSAVTYYCGFEVNDGEYKLMGLAPYGDEHSSQYHRFRQKILNNLVDVRNDGSLLLNMDYFEFATGLRMTNNQRWTELFGLAPRIAEGELKFDYMNLALAFQRVAEEIIFKLAQTARSLTGSSHLVMAGGVALNSVANGKLAASGIFDDIWIQPAASDAGGALGAAMLAYHMDNQELEKEKKADQMLNCQLGPYFTNNDIKKFLQFQAADYQYWEDEESMFEWVATQIANGKIFGWFRGRMEFGPRALGNRSILADPRNPDMQRKLNLKIKFRESFRPFAPSVLEEDAAQYFDLKGPSPYMLQVVPLLNHFQIGYPDQIKNADWKEKLYFHRSEIPSITHVDYTARVQTVNQKANPDFYQLLQKMKKITGIGMLINTSFNLRGEPIVCSPADAYRCFNKTEMDYLALENFIINKLKSDQ